MPQQVVDGLKAVQIDIDHTDLVLALPCVFNFRLQPAKEFEPIGDPGQVIMAGFVFELVAFLVKLPRQPAVDGFINRQGPPIITNRINCNDMYIASINS